MVLVGAAAILGYPVHPDTVTDSSPTCHRGLLLVTEVIEVQPVDQPTARRVGDDHLRPSDASGGAAICGHHFIATRPEVGIDGLMPDPDATPTGRTELSFEVSDIPAEIDDLKRRGVAFADYDLPG